MKLFIKDLFFFIFICLVAPLLILVMGYLYFDPFKIVKKYDDFSYSYVVPNRDYISTEMFLNNYKKQGYNSFIFGSSRTMGFSPISWKTYLPKKAKPFVFDASGESIYGIYKKMLFLDSKKVKIDNAIILLCRDASFLIDANPVDHHLFMKHPEISKESMLTFQFNFFTDYLRPKFLFAYYTYTFSKKYRFYMDGYIEKRKIIFDKVTNQMKILDQEYEIKENEKAYYRKRKAIFYTRYKEETDSVAKINNKHIFMLKEIKRILSKNRTNYKVIISPMYDQVKFNPIDLKILKIFFQNHLYDFSGKNSYNQSKTNFYESTHFRPIVGDSIYKIVYK